jgi:hypothetical protein
MTLIAVSVAWMPTAWLTGPATIIPIGIIPELAT